SSHWFHRGHLELGLKLFCAHDWCAESRNREPQQRNQLFAKRSDQCSDRRRRTSGSDIYERRLFRESRQLDDDFRQWTDAVSAVRSIFLLVFCGAPSTDTRTTTFTIAGTGLTAASVGFPGVFAEGNNYVHFSSHQADVAGQLSVTIQGSGGIIVS